MKFLDIIDRYSSTIVKEQDAAPAADIPQVDAQPPSQPQIDEPAGIATMGNLLKKALSMKISDEDRYKISQLPEVNEKNASKIIDQLISIMKSYSVDIDIDSNTNTSI